MPASIGLVHCDPSPFVVRLDSSGRCSRNLRTSPVALGRHLSLDGSCVVSSSESRRESLLTLTKGPHGMVRALLPLPIGILAPNQGIRRSGSPNHDGVQSHVVMVGVPVVGPWWSRGPGDLAAIASALAQTISLEAEQPHTSPPACGVDQLVMKVIIPSC